MWHGCARRPVTRPAPPPSPPPAATVSAPAVSDTWESPLVLEIGETVATFMSRCKSLEEPYDALEARLTDFAIKQVSMDTVLNTLVEGQKLMIATVSSIDAEVGALTSRLDKMDKESSAPSSFPHGAQPVSECPASSYTISSRIIRDLARLTALKDV